MSKQKHEDINEAMDKILPILHNLGQQHGSDGIGNVIGMVLMNMVTDGNRISDETIERLLLSIRAELIHLRDIAVLVQ